jgi:hypothetical protein
MFINKAILIYFHTRAPTRKATIHSAFLSLVRAAKHRTGLPAKRRAARAVLHKVMKLAFSLTIHTNTSSNPQNGHSPSSSKTIPDSLGRVGNLWPNFCQFQHLDNICRCTAHEGPRGPTVLNKRLYTLAAAHLMQLVLQKRKYSPQTTLTTRKVARRRPFIIVLFQTPVNRV